MVSGKHAFWQAFLFAIFIFSIGILLGFFLEVRRTGVIENALINSELDLLDEQLRTRAASHFVSSCDDASKGLFEFADRVYSEALLLEEYDASSTLSKQLYPLHKRYDVLRTMLWIEALELRERCSGEFHTVVYLYDYNPESIDQRAHQALYSRLVADLKRDYPSEVLLLPIAANTGLSSIEGIRADIGVTSLPAIIIDERTVIYDIITLDELKERVFERHN